MGMQMIRHANSTNHEERPQEVERAKPLITVTAMAGFQIVNPKSWVLALTVVTTYQSNELIHLFPLVSLAVVIPAMSLLTWAFYGSALGEFLCRPSFRFRTNIFLGLLLIAFALSLVVPHP